MADAQWPVSEQMQDAKSRRIAKALVNLNQFHVTTVANVIYSSRTIFVLTHIDIEGYSRIYAKRHNHRVRLCWLDSRHLHSPRQSQSPPCHRHSAGRIAHDHDRC